MSETLMLQYLRVTLPCGPEQLVRCLTCGKRIYYLTKKAILCHHGGFASIHYYGVEVEKAVIKIIKNIFESGNVKVIVIFGGSYISIFQLYMCPICGLVFVLNIL